MHLIPFGDIEKALLKETELSFTQIDNMRFSVDGYINKVESFLRKKQLSNILSSNILR